MRSAECGWWCVPSAAVLPSSLRGGLAMRVVYWPLMLRRGHLFIVCSAGGSAGSWAHTTCSHALNVQSDRPCQALK